MLFPEKMGFGGGIMREDRMERVFRVLRGTLAAGAITLLLMAGITLLVIYAGLRTAHLTAINQAVKLVSILAGTLLAVGIGGEKGLLTGALVGMLYMLLGYGFYSLIDGSEPTAKVLAMEIAAGALVGAVTGVVLANLRGRRA